MSDYLREVQLANMLGFTEIEDFRRAIAAGNVPDPDQHLGPKKKKPIWSKEKIDLWLGKRAQKQEQAEIWSKIGRVA